MSNCSSLSSLFTTSKNDFKIKVRQEKDANGGAARWRLPRALLPWKFRAAAKGTSDRKMCNIFTV